MPSRLSEAAALDLLRVHCSVLRRRLVFDASREDGALVKQVWMSLLCLHVSDSDLAVGFGYELRVAIDIVNALCACSGFSPERNHRFWRTAVAELWIEYTDDEIDRRRTRCRQYLFQPPSHMMLPFDAAAFSCFSIDFQEYPASGFEPTLVELWRQVAWTDVISRCPAWILERRQTVLSQLLGGGVDVVRLVRTLQLELIVPANSVCAAYLTHPPALLALDWAELSRALPTLGRQSSGQDETSLTSLALKTSSRARPAVPLAASTQQLSVALHPDGKYAFYLHSSNLGMMQQLLCGCHSVTCLTLDVRLVPEADADALVQVRRFGELLRALLVDTKTLKTLRLRKWVTQRMVAAVASVLPVATSLESLLISAWDAMNDACVHQWAWLEYGLSHPLRREGRVPELMLAVDETTANAADADARFQEIRRATHPLQSAAFDMLTAALVPDDRREVVYEWYAVGTTVARVCVAIAEVFLDPPCHGPAVTDVTCATELDTVVRVAHLGVVGVVVRGYGLCWIAARAVTTIAPPWVRTEHEQAASGARLYGLTHVSVRDGTWVSSPSPSGLPIARWLNGVSIRSLALVWLDVSHDLRDDKLEPILRCCPNLTTLLLEGYGTESLQILVDAYARTTHPCLIASLSVVTGLSFHSFKRKCLPLLEMLSNPHHPGTQHLRHLSLVASGRQCLHPCFRAADVARMLATNVVLESVYVFDCDYDSQQDELWNDAAHTLLKPFQDQVLEDCSRVAMGLLSVHKYYGDRGDRGDRDSIWKRTRRCKRYGGIGRVDTMVVRHILSFVGPTRVRCMRWMCEQTFSFPSLTIDRFWKRYE